MNKKYISPTIEIADVEITDVILASGAYEITQLEGVDTGDDKSAVFSVGRWFE
ncbi:MAG: hypothetical protein J6A90_02000 [Clostridia bacterium]|nr:hypothetical protein [Clostridia bacterium]